jgi:ketosteroid isomerase-like protein
MSIDEQTVRSIFAGLEHGDGDAFFEHVADDVDWTVMGTHPLAGHYRSKSAFQEGTFGKLGKVLPNGAQLSVTNVAIAGDVAVVELVSGATARNGMRFDNHYCWVVRFDRGTIAEVRAYLDSAMVAELFRQNPV